MSENKVLLGTTALGQNIYIGQETYEHMQAHPDVSTEHIIEAISKIKDYNGQFRIGSVDLGRTIGKDTCIEVSVEEAIMVYRKGREGLTPVVFNQEPADTNLITIGMCHDDDGKDTFFTAFYGQLAPKEPWDKNLSPEQMTESEEFWNGKEGKRHALIVTDDAIDWERTVNVLDANEKKFITEQGYGLEYLITNDDILKCSDDTLKQQDASYDISNKMTIGKNFFEKNIIPSQNSGISEKDSKTADIEKLTTSARGEETSYGEEDR